MTLVVVVAFAASAFGLAMVVRHQSEVGVRCSAPCDVDGTLDEQPRHLDPVGAAWHDLDEHLELQ